MLTLHCMGVHMALATWSSREDRHMQRYPSCYEDEFPSLLDCRNRSPLINKFNIVGPAAFILHGLQQAIYTDVGEERPLSLS